MRKRKFVHCITVEPTGFEVQSYGVSTRFSVLFSLNVALNLIHAHSIQELGGDLEDALEPPPRTNGSASVLTQKMEGLTMTPPSALPPHHMAAASPHGPLTVQTAGPPLTPGGPAYPGHYAPHHLLPPSAFASAGPALQVCDDSFEGT